MVDSERDISLQNIAIVGNPNCGKTTLFNALTGLRQKVGNYPGVTVEKKEGRIMLGNGAEVSLLDLPGTYSLSANSPDEKIVCDVLFGRIPETPIPDAIICVVDATNIERNFYLLSQILDLGFPVIVALNMYDVALRNEIHIDIQKLEATLGVPCIPTVASRGTGVHEILKAVPSVRKGANELHRTLLPQPAEEEFNELVSLLQTNDKMQHFVARHEAQTLLSTPKDLNAFKNAISHETLSHVRKDYERFTELGFDRHSIFVESRYKWIHQIYKSSVKQKLNGQKTIHDTIDGIVTHRVWGFVIFFGLMGIMFQTIFAWANYPMELISEGFDLLGNGVGSLIPPGDLHDLIVNGAISGVGAVVTFLPQILFLFLFHSVSC